MELVLNHFNKIFLPQLKIFDMIRKIAIIGFFNKEKLSFKNVLNDKGPKTDSCGTPLVFEDPS